MITSYLKAKYVLQCYDICVLYFNVCPWYANICQFFEVNYLYIYIYITFNEKYIFDVSYIYNILVYILYFMINTFLMYYNVYSYIIYKYTWYCVQ